MLKLTVKDVCNHELMRLTCAGLSVTCRLDQLAASSVKQQKLRALLSSHSSRSSVASLLHQVNV